MMQYMLATGVNPETGTPHGDAPLTGAVFLRHTKAAEVLPKFGARVNAKSRGGGESGLPETGSSGEPHTIGMEQINHRLEIIQYG